MQLKVQFCNTMIYGSNSPAIPKNALCNIIWAWVPGYSPLHAGTAVLVYNIPRSQPLGHLPARNWKLGVNVEGFVRRREVRISEWLSVLGVLRVESISTYSLLGAGSTLVPSCSILSAEIIFCNFQIFMEWNKL